jgi:hypothetical protein
MPGEIKYFKEGTRASASHLNQLVDACNGMGALRGDGLVAVNGNTIGLNMGMVNERISRPTWHFFAKLTGNATDGDNKWKYSWEEVALSAAGYGNWATFTNARTGSTSTDPARNFLENMNAATGVQGNGVDVANLDTATATFTMQPIPTNAIVRMEIVVAADGTVTYWFSVPNGTDGTCD